MGLNGATRVAVDLLGGGSPPEGAFEALLGLADADPDLVLTIVAAPELAAREFGERAAGTDGKVTLKFAARSITPGPDAVRQVRAYRDSGVRVAARLVRDDAADAMVSCGPLEAVVASARFTLGLLPGATLASSAVVVDAAAGPVVLCDAGATADASADQLVQHATTAAAYVSVLLGVRRPRVGLLGGRGAVSDAGRRTADVLLSSLLEANDVDYVGVVGARGLVAGTDIDVLVADGATGEIVTDLLRELGRGGRAGMAVLGVGGSVVATQPHSGADLTAADSTAADLVAADLVSAVGLAATSFRSALPAAVGAGLDRLRTNRRATAGLAS